MQTGAQQLSGGTRAASRRQTTGAAAAASRQHQQRQRAVARPRRVAAATAAAATAASPCRLWPAQQQQQQQQRAHAVAVRAQQQQQRSQPQQQRHTPPFWHLPGAAALPHLQPWQKPVQQQLDSHHQQHQHQQQQQQQHFSAARAQPPAVVYLPNFLHPDDFAAVRRECRALAPKLKAELNTVAVGRLGCYLPRGSATAAILSSAEVARALTERLRSPAPLFASDFPMELRTYAKSAHMPWHKDEQLYEVPQWEIILTVENTSDSVTQWRDAGGKLHERATDANSVLAVLAEAWDHRVTPARTGSRSIIKFAYTSCAKRLPAFQANLEREAYAS